jgi:hypothetical protein
MPKHSNADLLDEILSVFGVSEQMEREAREAISRLDEQFPATGRIERSLIVVLERCPFVVLPRPVGRVHGMDEYQQSCIVTMRIGRFEREISMCSRDVDRFKI